MPAGHFPQRGPKLPAIVRVLYELSGDHNQVGVDAGAAIDGLRRRQSAPTAYRKHCGARVRTWTVVTSGLLSRRSMIG